jgi:succinate dehydrogenase / fumarate reductase flavoprotein subunit
MTETEVHSHDILIIGGGLTGLRAAIEAHDRGAEVAIISKVHPLRSHSVSAQGGINAALGNNRSQGEDSWEAHALDTVKGADYLADQDAAALMCRSAPAAVIELEHMGTVFSRSDDGKIAQRPFGGAGFPRTCYAADRTGHNLLHTLYEQITDRQVPVYEEFFVTSLVDEGGRCVGCIAFDILDGAFHGFASKCLLLATGGYGRLFSRSTNAHINTGDGAALGLRAGVALEDMEFVQFHPTTLYGTNILMSEAARGEGGLLFNNRHERFMKAYAPKAMELAPRDIVARAMGTEIDQGRGFEGGYLHLDLTGLGKERIMERLPGIRQIAMDFAGVDPIERPIPVQPGQHYSMGGVRADNDTATSLPGLYAAGECSCISVHGANRLGGNSLLETVVFGKIAGQTMAQKAVSLYPPATASFRRALDADGKLADRLMSCQGEKSTSQIKDELKATMFECFGVFREDGKMREGLARLERLRAFRECLKIDDTSRSFNQALVYAFETRGMLDLAQAVALSALAREESRGSHFRTDFPKRDDARFLRHTLILVDGDGMKLQYAPVRLGMFPVKEREY